MSYRRGVMANSITSNWQKNEVLLTDFYQQAISCIKTLEAHITSLIQVEHLFDREMVSKDQCVFARKLINNGDSLNGFCTVLASFDHLPIAAATSRHSLLLTLQQTETQVHDLDNLILQFQDISNRMSGKTLRRKQEILHRLQRLINSCEEAVIRTQNLLDQMRFHNQLLESISF